jgi:hypothetical protein
MRLRKTKLLVRVREEGWIRRAFGDHVCRALVTNAWARTLEEAVYRAKMRAGLDPTRWWPVHRFVEHLGAWESVFWEAQLHGDPQALDGGQERPPASTVGG